MAPKPNSPARQFIVDVTCWLFIALWMYAATSKLMDLQTFQTQIGQSPLLTPFSGLLSWTVPFAEIILAIGLIGERTRLIALYGSFTLMLLFSGYIFVVMNYSDYVPCSCGGILGKMAWETHLLFNIFFTLLAAIAAMLYQKKYFVATNQG